MEEQKLTKKEKRALARQKKLEERIVWKRRRLLTRLGLGAAALIFVIGGGFWFYRQATTSLPGLAVEIIGDEHVADGTLVDYNSNPPTSGPHYDAPTPAGIYDKPISDGHLIHSLEHGYVIISYNCERKVSKVPSLDFASLGKTRDKRDKRDKQVSEVFAHEEELPVPEATEGGELEGDVWQSQECDELKQGLTALAQENRLWKLIVIPRLGLETRLALTAWGRIDKFDQFDQERIVAFIRAFRDKGPEKTPD